MSFGFRLWFWLIIWRYVSNLGATGHWPRDILSFYLVFTPDIYSNLSLDLIKNYATAIRYSICQTIWIGNKLSSSPVPLFIEVPPAGPRRDGEARGGE